MSMKFYCQFTLITLVALTALTCSKSESTPDPDLTSAITGVYNLSQLTKKDGGAAVTGVGSATIAAVDKTNVKVRQVLAITKSASSRVNVDVTNNYKISQSGSTYTIQYEYDTNKTTSVGTVSGSKLSTTDMVLSGEPTLTTLVAEYTK
jgi:hypothetical protein